MTAIKEYKPVLKLELRTMGWQQQDIYDLPEWATIEKMAKALSDQSKFIVVWDRIINKSDIRQVLTHKPKDDIEAFVYEQPGKVKERLTNILKDRKEKQLNTNGLKHLVEIYNSKYKDDTILQV